jgi:hypothetical protein
MATINIMIAVRHVDVEIMQTITDVKHSQILHIIGKNRNPGCCLAMAHPKDDFIGADNRLSTRCKSGDVLIWTAYPVNPDHNTKIHSITGQATINSGGGGAIFQRLRGTETPAGTPYFTCVINQDARLGVFDYNITLELSTPNSEPHSYSKPVQVITSSVEIVG